MTAQPGSILLVDHSRNALLFQETILRRRKTTAILTALAGSDGLEKARQEKPQLVMFGFDLFDMTGPDFCRQIRAEEATRSISLLLVTDEETPEHADLCLSAGCNDFIRRPLQHSELDAKIEKLTHIPVRRQLRTMTRIEVSLEKDGRFVLGRSINISSNGMLLEVERTLPGDATVRVHFYLPSDPSPLQLEAAILRADFSGPRAHYGLKFLSASDGERERIERYVARLRSRELI